MIETVLRFVARASLNHSIFGIPPIVKINDIASDDDYVVVKPTQL